MTNLVLFPYVERICRGLGVDFYGVGNAAEQDNVKTSDFSSSSPRSFPLLCTDVTVSKFFFILYTMRIFFFTMQYVLDSIIYFAYYSRYEPSAEKELVIGFELADALMC